MADEAQYSSGTESTPLKRKYDDQSTTAHRPTGFSSPPSAAVGIELAKQRAQEVAARLLSGAAAAPPLDAKRLKPDGGAPASGLDSFDLKPQYSSPSAGSFSYGHQGTTKKIEIPNGRVGVIIGKGGETIKYLQLQSGAKIQVTRDMDADPNSTTRMVELMGSSDAIASAEKLINEVLAEAEAGGSGVVGRRITGQAGGSDEFVMKIPNNKVGLIIGKGGETIKNMQASTGARIQVIPLHLPPGDTSTERTLKIDGTPEQIESAKQLVDQILSGENRLRNPAMSGGYPQQGYQSRPPSSWAPSAAPMQQGYGYVQPGAYSGPSPQYNMHQPPYAGYPPQQSGGYSTNWDQSAAPTNQQSTHAGGYDYYGQQPQQQANPAVDGSAYNYSQQPSSGYNQSGQGYAQDSYNAYNAPPQSGYGQPPYDQQQGYTAPSSYGSGSNPAQGDSTVGQQGYSANQQPSSNTANYPPQGAQTGYGAPATSQAAYGNQAPSGYGPPQSQKPGGNPPVYGQSQSPSGAAGGYGQSAYPAQPPPSGYGQPESGAQRAPPSGYSGAVQPGYGSQSYGAPQGGQPGYGQAPPPYGNSSYGTGGYSQTPPAYATDGAPAQAAPQSGVAKASPQS